MCRVTLLRTDVFLAKLTPDVVQDHTGCDINILFENRLNRRIPFTTYCLQNPHGLIVLVHI